MTITAPSPVPTTPEALDRAAQAVLALSQRRTPLSKRHPSLLPLARFVHRSRRRLDWLLSDTTWARTRAAEDLPVRVKQHGSLLLRRLGDSEMWLQHNKVTNLRLAAAQTDGVLIRPGETFSFNKIVGDCTARKGYVEGMRLSNGEARPGVGGGICQLANLLHWMFLHSPLTVVERSEHSFDPFPDNKRVLPWGVGCSIVYPYLDLAVRNDTQETFQVRTWVAEKHLRGELRTTSLPAVSYKVAARDEEFLRVPTGEVYRRNEIWRTTYDKRTGAPLGEECVKHNLALVKYLPDEDRIRDVA